MEEFPPGFRFYPTEEELISFYLHYKLQEINEINLDQVIPVVDIYEQEPWHLPKFSGELCRNDTEQWFFFVPRQEREARGGRPNRTTRSGYWKATGSPNYVYSTSNKVIGVKKTMVFYKGKAPSGRKTKWKMNEYRAIEEELVHSASSSATNSACPRLRHEMSVCRVYVVSGSSRAFDRRPLGTVMREIVEDQEIHHENGVTNNCVDNIEKTSSPESSYLREIWPDVDLMEINEGTTSNSETMNIGLDLEHLDWE